MLSQAGMLTDDEIDRLCAPGRAKRWHGDGRQYDRDTARLVEVAVMQRQVRKPAWPPSMSRPRIKLKHTSCEAPIWATSCSRWCGKASCLATADAEYMSWFKVDS